MLSREEDDDLLGVGACCCTRISASCGLLVGSTTAEFSGVDRDDEEQHDHGGCEESSSHGVRCLVVDCEVVVGSKLKLSR